MTLTEKHLQAIDDNVKLFNSFSIMGKEDAAKECSRISLEFAIEALEDLNAKFHWVNIDAFHDTENKISILKNQLSEL